MSRISRQQMFMQMAEVAAMRSTCYRGNTGALIVYDNDVISTGYNGPPSGEEHCRGNDCQLSSTGGCRRSIHAETNAIDRALNKVRNSHTGPTLGRVDLYTISAPCPLCAERVCLHGIPRVFYRHPYRIPEGLLRLTSYGVRVYRILPGGIIIDEVTRGIVDPEELPRHA